MNINPLKLIGYYMCHLLLNSLALVRKRTIPTERPQLVGEVSANFLRVEGIVWSAHDRLNHLKRKFVSNFWIDKIQVLCDLKRKM
jgi:hypothetical protein